MFGCPSDGIGVNAGAMTVKKTRVILFALWCVLFIAYLGMFLAVGRWRDVIDVGEARDAARQVMYIFLPVLGAFAGFWFTPEADNRTKGQPKDDAVLSGDRVFAGFALTGVVHFVVFGYFLMYVVFGEFSFSPNHDESFVGVVAWGLNLLVALSSLVLLPVGYLTKQKLPPIELPEPNAQ